MDYRWRYYWYYWISAELVLDEDGLRERGDCLCGFDYNIVGFIELYIIGPVFYVFINSNYILGGIFI